MSLFTRILCGLGLSLLACSPHAAIITVNSSADDTTNNGNCTLREALLASNFNVAIDQCVAGNSTGGDTIFVLPGSSGDSIIIGSQLPIIDAVQIIGPGEDNLVIAPNTGVDTPIFQINTSGDVQLAGMRLGGARSSAVEVINVDELEILSMRLISNQAQVSSVEGGAIHAAMGEETESINRLTITDSEFLNNTASIGGAIAIRGDYPVEISDSLFSGNSATASGTGGAIYAENDAGSYGTIMLISTTRFINNSGTSIGGALRTRFRSTNIERSLFQGNSAQFGSAISITNSILSVNGSLFTENLSSNSNGGVVSVNGSLGGSLTAEALLRYNTFSGNNPSNQAPSLEINGNGNLTTVVIQSNAFDDDSTVDCLLVGTPDFFSTGANLEFGQSCAIEGNDFPNALPRLLPLGNYGGSIQAMPPSPTSLLVDAGLGSCLTLDLSVQTRPQDGDADGDARCDIGASERPDARLLTLDKAGNGTGTIGLSVFDLECVDITGCEYALPEGQMITLTAQPDPGSTFVAWGGACSGDTSCTVTLNSDQTVSAEFALPANPVTLTVTKSVNGGTADARITSAPGGIDCGSSCQADFIDGDVVTLTAQLLSGAEINEWIGCDFGSGMDETCVVTLTADTTIELNLNGAGDALFADGFE